MRHLHPLQGAATWRIIVANNPTAIAVYAESFNTVSVSVFM